MMNSKSLLGDNRPEGSSLLRWNILMIIATTVATLGAAWASHGKIGWWGPGLILTFGALALLTRQKQPQKPAKKNLIGKRGISR